MQLWEAGILRKGLRQNFGAEARSAHPEHDRVGKILSLYLVREVFIVRNIGRRRAREPTQPLVFVGTGPDRFVVPPEAADLGGRPPVLRAFFDGAANGGAQRQLLPIDAAAQRRCALMRDRAVKLVGGVGELLDAVL